MKRILGWLDSLSSKAILNTLDKRKVVKERDLRKIYPLFFQKGQGEEVAAVHEMEQAIHEQIHDQISSFASVLHNFLEERKDTVPSAKAPVPLPDSIMFPEEMAETAPRSMFEKAVVPCVSTEAGIIPTFNPKVQLADVSSMFQSRFGYSLRVAESSVSHPEAGMGLWLSGRASAGHVVGLFPGINYAPIHYREMLGYPKIDEDNPYLISRYDGIIIDSKPWGSGLYEEHTFPGTTQTFAELYELERRHPLAFAHLANHPPKGTLPNVLLAPFDVQADVTSRPYLPNVKCVGQCAIREPNEVVQGLVLIANREMQDEEIFVNYRLNPLMARPKWYAPVDEKEDLMRWS